MNTWSRWRSIASIILVSSSPARPTKGRPVSSSVWPGPSPTNMSRASGFPSPGTVRVRPWQRKHLRQPAIVAATSSSVLQGEGASSSAGTTMPGTVGIGGASVDQCFAGRIGGTARLLDGRTVWEGGRSPTVLPSVEPTVPERMISFPPRALCSSRYFRRASDKGRLDPVENAFRDARLGSERYLPFRSVFRHNGDPVGVHLEPRPRLGGVVDHNQVQQLALQLFPAFGKRVAGFQRKPDYQASRFPERAGGKQDVGGRGELDRKGTMLAGALHGIDLLRPVVRRGRGHDEHVRLGKRGR